MIYLLVINLKFTKEPHVASRLQVGPQTSGPVSPSSSQGPGAHPPTCSLSYSFSWHPSSGVPS